MLLRKSNFPQKITFTQEDGIQNVFIRGEIIGTGSFSIVYLVTHQNTNKIYAMKVIPKEDYSKNKLALMDLENEIKIQKLVNHPNVVKSDFSFSDALNHYFVLEYCPGGTIRNYLSNSRHFHLGEPEIRKIIKDVIQGLVYIHGLEIIHHDIKLENLIIDSNGNVKIADFGLSNFQKNENEKKSIIFGTLKYMSPEMLEKTNKMKSCKIDIWAVGVSTFYLLTGNYPFDEPSEKKMIKCIKKGELHFPLNYKITDEIKDFISEMLQIDPEMRPTAKELLNHPFLNNDYNDNVCLYNPKKPQPLIMEKVEIMKKDPGQQQKERKETDQKKESENLKPSMLQTLCENRQICQKNQTENLKPIKSSVTISQKQQNGDLKQSFCPTLGNNKIISPGKPNENLKPSLRKKRNRSRRVSKRRKNVNLNASLCPPLKSSRPVSKRQQTGDLKPSFCPPPSDSKLISPRRPNDNLNSSLCPPLNNSKPVSQKQQTGDLNPSFCPPPSGNKTISPGKPNVNLNASFCPPLNSSIPVSQMQQTGDLKPSFCQPPNDNKLISLGKPNDNLNSSFCHPLNNSKPVSQKQQTGDLNPSFCQPPSDNKLISPGRPNDNLNSSFCPPLNSSIPVSQMQQTSDLNPSFCPPPSDNKLISLGKPNDNLNSSFCPPLNNSIPVLQMQQTCELNPSFCPPLNKSMPVSQMQQAGDLKLSFCPPPSDNKHISPRRRNSNLKKARLPPRQIAAYSILAYRNQSRVEDFIIPSYFVSRFCFYKDNLSYLLFDGTVGFCFKDKSRIVMEPNEQFAQFYKDSNTQFPDIICLSNAKEKNEHEKISLLKNAARNFKKIRFSYELESAPYDPDYIFHNIKRFVKYEDSILFKLDGMNFQVNFNDHSKLIIFWNLKKFCFFKSFNEFSTLLDLKKVTSMNPDSDEHKKIKQANVLLSELSLAIC
ncbi:hypothetical protein M9Y10_036127 [Tritrichomonas musculus]|uniref:Serine/threonine-protein kinase PLK n=1 Tax=Tritrichomonas musculus TaxID=1915356 RepID=A0ABR2GUQ1_9EUKA